MSAEERIQRIIENLRRAGFSEYELLIERDKLEGLASRRREDAIRERLRVPRRVESRRPRR